MLSDQLIRIVESHAEELTRGVVSILQNNAHTPSYHAVPPEELHHRLFEIYHDLGHWLLGDMERSVQVRYQRLGRARCQEGVPLPEVLWALVLIKEHLRDSAGAFLSADSVLELHREVELFRLIGRYFDRAICCTAEAYEGEASALREKAQAAEARARKHFRLSSMGLTH